MTSNELIQETAALYALGLLTQHEARAFETLLAEGDAEAVSAFRDFESVVGLIGIEAGDAAPSASVKRQLIAATSRLSPSHHKTHTEFSPGLFHLRADEGRWAPFSEGIAVKVLSEDKTNGLVSVLLKMEPGAKILRHRHRGVEQCYVLEGDFHIGDQEYGPGDYQEAVPGSIHDEVFTNHGAMVLIIAPPEYDLV